MLKKLLALALCFALLASLTGCIGNDDAEDTAEEIAEEDYDKSDLYRDTSTWGNMTMHVAGYRYFPEDPLNYEYYYGAEEFSEKYGTEVIFSVGGKDGQGEGFIERMAAGKTLDIQYAFGISVFPLVFAQNFYTPIDEYINYETNEMIDEVTVEAAVWDGKHYGISSLPMQEMWYIAYNETWMKELGIKTPHEYFEEGAWTMDAYKEVNREAVAKGTGFYSSVSRPHTGTRYAFYWDTENFEAIVNYDSPDNFAWLGFWGDLLSNEQYNITTGGRVSERKAILRDDVMPNLIKDELTVETTDVIRYIHFPNPVGGLGSYLTDTHFLFPRGISEEKLPCAIALASYMANAKGTILMEETYKDNMTEADFNLYKENMENCYYLPRTCFYGVFYNSYTFKNDILAGKSVEEHIAENTEVLKEKAEEFNKKYSLG